MTAREREGVGVGRARTQRARVLLPRLLPAFLNAYISERSSDMRFAITEARVPPICSSARAPNASTLATHTYTHTRVAVLHTQLLPPPPPPIHRSGARS